MKSSRRILQQPEWDSWVYLQSVSLAEATLLTQNVCPHTYTLQAGAGLGPKIDYNKHKIIQAALNEIESRKAHWLVLVGGYPADAYKVVVDFPRFAQWVLKRNWVSAPAIDSFTAITQNISALEISPNPVTAKDQKVLTPQSTSLTLAKPQRSRYYNVILFNTLKGLIEGGNELPNAIEVLNVWRVQTPHGITEVASDYFKYLDDNDTVHVVELDALQKAISRLFKRSG